MRLDDLRQELEALASEAPASSHDAASAVRPAVRRLRLRGALAGVIALVVVLGAVVLIDRDHDRHQKLSITSPSTRTGLTAATIAEGHWSAMAPAPLTPRNFETVAWAGTRLIVWGGDDGQHVFDDGAAYDPTTETWRRLPPAPIAARTSASGVWTGHELIIWGGVRKPVGGYAADGAAFDPRTWSWRMIAAAPLAPRSSADMIWNGREVIVLGGHVSNSDTLTSVLDAAAYDPATNRWRSMAPLPGVSDATVDDLRVVWADGELLVWEQWKRIAPTLTTFGLQLIVYSAERNSWRVAPPSDDSHRNVFAPIWTGDVVVSPAVAPLCDLPDGAQNCGPPPTNLRGSTFDPVSNTWRAMPHGPADDGVSASVWTGDDLVVVSGGVVDGVTGNTLVPVGAAAAWSPSSNQWTDLPCAPFVPAGATAIWTGREILVWGSQQGGLRYGLGRATAPTAPASTTTMTTAIVPAKVINLPAIDQITELPAATSVSYRWGSAGGSIGFRRSNDQADDGAGPAVSAIDDAGNAYVFDQVNWRISVGLNGVVTTYPLAAPEEPIEAAVFDAQHRLVVAGLHNLMVFASDGRLLGRYPNAKFTPNLQVWSLQVRGSDVVAYVNNSERVVFTDRGDGYVPQLSAPAGNVAVRIRVPDRTNETLELSARASGGAEFDITGPEKFVYVPTTRLLPDGSIVAVMMLDPGEPTGSIDTPLWYVLIRLRPDGTAEFAKFSDSEGHMSNPSGPVMVADDDGLSVLSSSSTRGVKVERFRYDFLPD